VQHTMDRAQRRGSGRALPHVPASRAAIVTAVAVAVALAVWALVLLLGVDPVVGRGGDMTPVTTVNVVVSTLVAGVAGWGVHTVLCRTGRSNQWPFVGSTALAVSMNGPSWFADGASGVALMSMHVAVGVALIVGFSVQEHPDGWTRTRFTRCRVALGGPRQHRSSSAAAGGVTVPGVTERTRVGGGPTAGTVAVCHHGAAWPRRPWRSAGDRSRRRP